MSSQYRSKSICLQGQLLTVNNPKVMGVLNLTPDSFYKGSRYDEILTVLNTVEKMLVDGATFIDIGGYSSRPNSANVSPEEESFRVLPVIEAISKTFPESILSIDTFRASIAEKAIDAGAAMVNDISGGCLDPNMFQIVSEQAVPYIMMHMRGTPQTMTQYTDYNDLIKDIAYYFSKQIRKARTVGINDIIIDPGFGFSKTLSQNYQLTAQLNVLKTLIDLPILTGISRKSMIYKLLNTDADHALNGTTAIHMDLLIGGANILRVHDVKEAVETIKIFKEIKKYRSC